MKTKIKNIIIYIIVFAIVIASFLIPPILIKMQEKEITISVAKREETKNIESELDKNYLVKVINDLYKIDVVEEVSSVSIKSVDNDKSEYLTQIDMELTKLIENNILNKNEEKTFLITNTVIVEKRYEKDKENYYDLSTVYCNSNNNDSEYIDTNNCFYEMEVEKDTGKIIKLYGDKKAFNNEISKEELIKNYIKYLELDYIDDWKFEKGQNIMKSEKANISINFMEIKGNYTLTTIW